jgi:protoporphyrinogen/coproporphyrinogen III oxidase
MGADPRTIVIGGGISGLACAFRLRQLGARVTLLEASTHAGGLIATIKRNGFVFEAGPQFPRFPSALWQLVYALKLENEFVRADSRAKRYILKQGRLHPAPFSPLSLLFSRLVGVHSKYRLLSEVFRKSQPPLGEESLAEFIHRKFDGDVLDYLIEPLISTIFFADPNKMGMESAFPSLVNWERLHGSLVRGAIKSRNSGSHSQQKGELPNGGSDYSHSRLHVTDSLPTLGSFRSGLATLTDKLASELGNAIRFGACVENVNCAITDEQSGRSWHVRLKGGEEIVAENLVLATPAYVAAHFLENMAPDFSLLLSSITYTPMAIVSSGYDRTQVRHPLKGFGLMIPRCEGFHTFFTVWNTSLLAGRAPDGKVLITSFVRGANGENGHELSNRFAASVVEREIGKVLDITGPPVELMAWTYPQALPQFQVGHFETVARIQQSLRRFPGLHLASNYLSGRSLGECVEIAFRTAEDICRNLQM